MFYERQRFGTVLKVYSAETGVFFEFEATRIVSDYNLEF